MEKLISLEEFSQLVPRTFAVETVLSCNLHCPECAVGGNLITREKGFLSFNNFKIIADKIRPFKPKMFYLHLWGEPMLNKDVIRMTQYASEFSKTNISTNGNLLTPDLAEALMDAGVAQIIVSIDGMTQEVYQQYRVGGQLTRALVALEIFRDLNIKRGNKVQILPQFIVFKHNQHQMADFSNYCKRLGLEPLFKAPYIRKGSKFENSNLPEFKRQHFKNKTTLRTAMQGCEAPRDSFTILLDGSVVICCHDYNKVTCFGNVFSQDILEIWNSEEYRKYRWDIISGTTPDFCLNFCQQYYLDQTSEF